MFIKVTKAGKYEYAQLVESYRDEKDITRHRVILNLGRVDAIQNNPSFQRMALKLAELSNVKTAATNLEDISEAELFNYGYVVYRHLWEKFKLPGLLAQAAGKAQFDVNQAAFLMAVQHLLDPRSKRGTFTRQKRYFGLAPVELHHLYRTLDMLCKSKESLEEAMFYQNRTLFNMQVDVVFFDVTTFHFESVRQDSLKDFGYSKDGKVGEVQVVLGLLIDRTGRPVGYELFPGHTFEGNTLELALEKLEKRFGLNRVIIVADRGINSKLNLKRIRDKGYGYIVASRLKKMPQEVLLEALDPEGWQDGADIRYKVLDYVNRVKENRQVHNLAEKLIVTYAEARVKKDRADRERLVKKAELLLKDKSRIKAQAKRGGKKYLKETPDSSVDWVLDEEAILKDSRLDGYYALQTSETELGPKEVVEIYHDLWKIEESFRVMKSTLEVRPVFHWTEPRIKGHFMLCFLAFLLERTLEFKLAGAGIASSPEQIREALNSMNFAQVSVQGKGFLIKTKALRLANDIWRLFRLKPPKNITPTEELVL